MTGTCPDAPKKTRRDQNVNPLAAKQTAPFKSQGASVAALIKQFGGLRVQTAGRALLREFNDVAASASSSALSPQQTAQFSPR